jgi:hypothetical protein
MRLGSYILKADNIGVGVWLRACLPKGWGR